MAAWLAHARRRFQLRRLLATFLSSSQANIQLRYRWEIAPLSDLFVVYTRGGSLPNRAGFSPSFGDLFNDAVDEPLGEQCVVKLRYRLDN